MSVCGSVRDGARADICDEGDAWVVLKVLENGSFVGVACLIATYSNAQGCSGGCDCFDDHIYGYWSG